MPEDFRDFADGEAALAGPVTVRSVRKVAASGGGQDDDAQDDGADDRSEADGAEVVTVSEHSHVDEVADHAHVVAPVVTAGDVVAVEEADVTERLAVGDVQAHTVYVPPANGGAAVADREETEAEQAEQVEEAGQPATAAAQPATASAPAANGNADTDADADPETDEAPKRRGLRVRRAAKRPAGPPATHS
ncbi:hypothetical protein ACFQ9X_08200 [Catenulispora yoronensis]